MFHLKLPGEDGLDISFFNRTKLKTHCLAEHRLEERHKIVEILKNLLTCVLELAVKRFDDLVQVWPGHRHDLRI